MKIRLCPWIIQDGNYPDFVVGSDVAFALEFWSYAGFGITAADDAPAAPPQDVCSGPGVVRFIDDQVWVVELDNVLAYREQKAPRGLVVGSQISGAYELAVDPFFYCEYLHARPGIPALIYRWRIHGITCETAPLIEVNRPFGQTYLVPDESKIQRCEISETDAWGGDDRYTSYILTCERLPHAPSRKR